MAQEEEPTQKMIISDKSKVYQDMCAFHLSEVFSDVKVVVEDQKIPAHKVVLAARCDFFNSLLINSPDQAELRLTGVPLKALKEILKYIYTGSIVISLDKDLLLEVLKLAHDFSISTLETTISDEIKSVLDLANICFFLNRANENNLIELRDNCFSFIDKHISEGLGSDFCKDFTQASMMSLLERDSLPFHEIDVFRIAADWCKNNVDLGNSVMNCVRLHSLSKEEILKEVWPSKCVDPDKLLTAIAAIEDGSSKALHPRRRITETESSTEASVESGNGQSAVVSQNHIRRVKDENIATVKFNAQVIKGINTGRLLTENENDAYYTHHDYQDKNGIIVDLGEVSCFNHIRMKLQKDRNQPYCVKVSVNQLEWVQIINYSYHSCRSYQNLYFPEQNARYVQVIGASDPPVRVVNFRVFWVTYCPLIRQQYVCPPQNVATENMGASMRWVCLKNSERIAELQLAQPYYISRIQITRNIEDMILETYTPSHVPSIFKWITVGKGNFQEVSSWRTIDFPTRLVNSIRITSSSEYFTEKKFALAHIQCFY